jgi:hypothetical protein
VAADPEPCRRPRLSAIRNGQQRNDPGDASCAAGPRDLLCPAADRVANDAPHAAQVPEFSPTESIGRARLPGSHGPSFRPEQKQVRARLRGPARPAGMSCSVSDVERHPRDSGQPSPPGQSRMLRRAASRISCASMLTGVSPVPRVGQRQMNFSSPLGGRGQAHNREC